MSLEILDEEFVSSLPLSDYAQSLELISDKYFGKYLSYYLAVDEASKATDGSRLHTSADIIYQSRYYYFIKFYKLYQEKKSDNEGLYQTFMQLLEDRPFSTKWEFLVAIEEQVDKELKLLGLQPKRILLP